ncbi:MAG: hypothetical protein ACI8UD_004341 [Planctomycetota bacterium]|jgi:hypothetical protein
MDSKPSQASEKVIAIVIMAWGVGWLARYSAAASDDWLAVAVTGALGIAAMAVGFSVWKSSPRAVAAYIAWAVAGVVGLVTLDVLTETEVWKVALGGAGAALLLAVFGSALVSARRPQPLAV